MQKGRIVYYQRKLADRITTKMNEMISLLTQTLNIHLNIGQNLIINTSEIFMALEKMNLHLLSKRTIQQVENARFFIPLNFNRTHPISLRVRLLE